jgi:hypothetical protein
MEELGIDVSFNGGKAGATSGQFIRFNTAVLPVDPQSWDQLTAIEVVARMKDQPLQTGAVPVDLQKLPTAFLVKTAQSVGIMRLRQISEPDRQGQKGYWVEYKLVRR